MRWFLLISSGLLVIALAFWAYSQNYQTQTALKEAETLQQEIADLRERLAVLRAEWAYLNRPDRLRQLADMNFEKLGLLPLAPDDFGRVEQVGFPTDLGFPTVNPIDLAAILGAEGESE